VRNFDWLPFTPPLVAFSGPSKRVMEKLFQVRDLVWKMILLLGTRSGKFGRWWPSWYGPFRVVQVVPGNASPWRTLKDIHCRKL
jgi:hypothetical protein